VGIVLVLASVSLGSTVVRRADDRVPVYAARTALVPGRPLTESDLTRVEVQLGAVADVYLGAARPLGPGRFVLAEVRPGQLVPVTAVGAEAEVTVQPLTVPVDAGSAAALAVGSRVDVYVDPPATGQAGGGTTERAYAGPELALRAASVSALPHDDGGFGAGSSDRPVQVMAPTDAVRGLIAQLDRGSRVTLVPVPGSALGQPE
jgi:hypothetical protein